MTGGARKANPPRAPALLAAGSSIRPSHAYRVIPALAGIDSVRLRPSGLVISSDAVPLAPFPSANVMIGVLVRRARSRCWKLTG